MPELNRPLSDITVLELGHIVAGPYCALLLADLGADVIKVEHPESGDALRDGSESGTSIFNYVNRNKQSVTVDLKTDAGKEVFDGLVEDADVVIENYSPGTADSLGVGYDDLTDVNPELVYCSIKGFNDGPYADRPSLDPVAEAMAGLMSTTGYPDHPPARCGASIADMIASFNGALAITAAIRQRDGTGEGQQITSPMFEGTVGVMGGYITFSEIHGEATLPYGGGGQSQWAPYDVYETADEKWVFVGPSSQKHWEALCGALGLDELIEDARFETLADRRENIDELDSILADAVREHSREALVDRLVAADVPVAPVNNTAEVADDEHLQETDALIEIRTAEGKDTTVEVPGSPIRSTGFDRPDPEDPPEHGEDTEAILREMGYAESEIRKLKENGAV